VALTRRRAQRTLAIIWALGFLLFFIVLIYETLTMPLYRGKESEVGGWFSPLFVPTVSLIIGTLVAQAQEGGVQDSPADSFVFGFAVFVSLVYLGAVGATILAAAWDSSIEPLKMSSWYLGIGQGVVTGLLGAFFVKKEPKKEGGAG